MSVRVGGANSPIRILFSSVKSSKSKTNVLVAESVLGLRVLYLAHWKLNDTFVEANPDVPIRNSNH